MDSLHCTLHSLLISIATLYSLLTSIVTLHSNIASLLFTIATLSIVGVDWYSVPVGTVLSKGHVFTPTMLDLDNAQVNTLDHTTNGQVPLNHTEPAISEQDMDTDCNALDDTINCDRLTREQLEIIQQAIVLY